MLTIMTFLMMVYLIKLVDDITVMLKVGLGGGSSYIWNIILIHHGGHGRTCEQIT